MNYKISNTDYKNILFFYDQPIPKNKSELKNAAEDILALKLCRCIKKVNPSLKKKDEPKAIGICTQSVFNKKGLKRGDFKCLKKRSLVFTKNRKTILLKKNKTMKRK